MVLKCKFKVNIFLKNIKKIIFDFNKNKEKQHFIKFAIL